MIVWDYGDWTPLHDPHKSPLKGHLEWNSVDAVCAGGGHLVRMKPCPRDKTKQWLLIKAADEYAPPASVKIDEEVTSVLSER